MSYHEGTKTRRKADVFSEFMCGCGPVGMVRNSIDAIKLEYKLCSRFSSCLRAFVVTIEDFVLNSSTDLLSTATRTCSLERGLNGGFLALEVVAAGQPFQIGEFVARLLCQSFATRSLLTCGAKLMKAKAPPCNRRHVFHGFGRQRRGMPVAALR